MSEREGEEEATALLVRREETEVKRLAKGSVGESREEGGASELSLNLIT